MRSMKLLHILAQGTTLPWHKGLHCQHDTLHILIWTRSIWIT